MIFIQVNAIKIRVPIIEYIIVIWENVVKITSSTFGEYFITCKFSFYKMFIQTENNVNWYKLVVFQLVHFISFDVWEVYTCWSGYMIDTLILEKFGTRWCVFYLKNVLRDLDFI